MTWFKVDVAGRGSREERTEPDAPTYGDGREVSRGCDRYVKRMRGAA